MLRLGVFLLAIIVTAMALTRVPAVQDGLLNFAAPRVLATDFGESEHLRVYVCGSASPLGNSPSRAQACIAVITPDHFYLFDSGDASTNNLMRDGFPMERLDGVFLTHFHSDHIADLPDIKLNSWVAGRPHKLKIFGPKGVSKVVEGFNLAYTLDNDYRTAHHGEALLPRELSELVAETIEVGVVFDQDGLKVSMFEVVHDPIDPAVGYLVEYQGRRVVISGDSIVTDKTFEVAKGADLVFHDVLSPDALRPLIAAADKTGQDRLSTIMTDVFDYHADIDKLQQASQAAGVKQLVFYHMVPTPTNPIMDWIWQRDLDSNTVIADDGMVFELPAANQLLAK